MLESKVWELFELLEVTAEEKVVEHFSVNPDLLNMLERRPYLPSIWDKWPACNLNQNFFCQNVSENFVKSTNQFLIFDAHCMHNQKQILQIFLQFEYLLLGHQKFGVYVSNND